MTNDKDEFVLSDSEIVELREYLLNVEAEDDAVEIQCIVSGHQDKDQAAVARHDSDTARLVYHAIRNLFPAFVDIKQTVDEQVPRTVPPSIVKEQCWRLLSEKLPFLFVED